MGFHAGARKEPTLPANRHDAGEMARHEVRWFDLCQERLGLGAAQADLR